MMILATLPTFHEITGNEDGVVVGLIPIDLVTIQTILEEEETGFATIHYKSCEPLKTRMYFTELLSILDKQGVVDFTNLNTCMKVSKPLKSYIDELKRLEDLPKQQ